LSRWSLAVVLPATLCALWAFAGSDSTLPAGVDDVDVLLLYTQNTQGFLRSCGCSGSESVGLAQAVEVIRKLREQFPGKVLAVDVGNLADDEKRGRVVWQALCEAKYDAVSFGPADAKWAEAYWRLASERPLTVVGLPLDNAEPDGRSLSYLRQPFAVVQVGERRIGLLSTGPETALSAEQAKLLVDVASTLRTGCDLMVLLTYRSLAEERHFLEGDLGRSVDLVVGARGSDRLKEPIRVGHSYLLPAAVQGREVGLAAVRWRPAAADGGKRDLAVEFKPLSLTAASPTNQNVARALRTALAEEQQATLMESLAGESEKLAEQGYVSPERCGTCHEEALSAWRKSRHAQAVATLLKKGTAVPECLRCHSEAFRVAGKVLQGVSSQGVECTSCHEEGLLHLALPGATGRKSEARKRCAGCHTPERDNAFDLEKRWSEIRH